MAEMRKQLAEWGKRYLAERFWPRALPEEYSEWTKENPLKAAAKGGTPREWIDRKAPGYQASIYSEKRFPEMQEAVFASPAQWQTKTVDKLSKYFRTLYDAGKLSDVQAVKEYEDAIWKSAGVTYAPYGHYLKEIPNYLMKVKPEGVKDLLKAGKTSTDRLVQFDELFNDVPSLKRLPVEQGEIGHGAALALSDDARKAPLRMEIRGDTLRNPAELREALVHELQHGTDAYQGRIDKDYEDKMQEILLSFANTPKPSDPKDRINARALFKSMYNSYRDIGSERRAHESQARLTKQSSLARPEFSRYAPDEPRYTDIYRKNVLGE